jgi:putative endonuclease
MSLSRAIEREKQLKRWTRAKKIALIERGNPTWQDLSEDWGKSFIEDR